jgi:hypothetical protein
MPRRIDLTGWEKILTIIFYNIKENRRKQIDEKT